MKEIILVTTFLFCTLILSDAQAKILKPIKLWKTHVDSGKNLLESIKFQKYTYLSYSRTELPMQVLSDLLWVADGYRHETSIKYSTAFEVQKIEIYVAMKKGLYKYNPEEHILYPIMDEDIRWLTGKHDYVKDAPVTFIYVA